MLHTSSDFVYSSKRKTTRTIKITILRTINLNKYQSNAEQISQNPHLNHLIDPSFQGVKRILVLSFDNATYRTVHTEYHLRKVQINGYNVMVNGKNVFDQPIKIYVK